MCQKQALQYLTHSQNMLPSTFVQNTYVRKFFQILVPFIPTNLTMNMSISQTKMLGSAVDGVFFPRVMGSLVRIRTYRWFYLE